MKASILLFALGCLLNLGAAKPSLAANPVDYQSVQAEGGKNLRYRKLDNGYLLVLVPGQEVIQSLIAFQKAMGIKLGSATGLGDVERTLISHFNTKTMRMDKTSKDPDDIQTYSPGARALFESNELSSLICTLSTLIDANGKSSPLLHCHVNVALSSDEGNRVLGGHLFSAKVSVVVEIMITTFSQEANKTHDNYFNGNLFDLNALDVVSN